MFIFHVSVIMSMAIHNFITQGRNRLDWMHWIENQDCISQLGFPMPVSEQTKKEKK